MSEQGPPPGGPPSGGPPPGGPPPGPPPAAGDGTPPAPESGGGPTSGQKAALVSAIVVVLALVVGGIAYLVSSDDSSDDASDEVTVAEGEVFLEPANSVGPDPFGEPDVPEVDPDDMEVDEPDPAPTGQLVSETGDTPGLYGGTRDSSRCDPQQLSDFLTANPDKAQAWVDALNRDDTLAWSGGSSLTVGDIPDFIAELTPITLTVDTRVTNYGFAGGSPTPRPAVLQRGTAVLVDAYGVPRAKCNCGNPLTKPTPTRGTVTYTGDRWTTFQPTTVIVVVETTIEIDVFVLTDYVTGEEFERPAATTGSEDRDVQEVERPSRTTTTEAPTTTIGETRTGATSYCEALDYYVNFAQTSDLQDDAAIAQFFIDVFVDLAALAPDEVKADWELWRDTLVPPLEAGDLDAVIDTESPALQAAEDRITAHALSACGINLDE